MNKEELIRKVSKELEISISDIRLVINCIIDTINDALLKRETVDIIGLCKMRVKATKPHYVMNMKTKERYMCEPKYKVDFKINDKIREQLNKQKVLWEDMVDLENEQLRKQVIKKRRYLKPEEITKERKTYEDI